MVANLEWFLFAFVTLRESRRPGVEARREASSADYSGGRVSCAVVVARAKWMREWWEDGILTRS